MSWAKLFLAAALALLLLAPGAGAVDSLKAAPAPVAPASVDKYSAAVPEGDAWFGGAVAVSGDRIVVGEPLRDRVVAIPGGTKTVEDTGAVYLYTRTSNGWQVEEFGPSDWDYKKVNHGWCYGSAVAIAGDRIVIGAPRAGLVPQGAVYVYDRVPGGWQETIIRASDKDDGDLFGAAVALSGNRIVVGAPERDTGGDLFAGAAYVYDFSGGAWHETILEASDAAPNHKFGEAVAVDGDTVLVGAPWWPGAAHNKGKAYLFTKEAGGWVESALAAWPAPSDDDYFGTSVALDGGLAVVGSPRDQRFLGDWYCGTAYVFRQGAGGWEQETLLTASTPCDIASPFNSTAFGAAVAVRDGVIVVGAPGQDDGANESAGAAARFREVEGVWTGTLLNPHAASHSSVGAAVALDGNRFVVGAYADDLGSGDWYDAGAVYLFEWHFCNRKPATLVGTDGDDVLAGTALNDVIVGRAGNDVISGLGGGDVICAGGGDDEVNAGIGNDRVWGEEGNDLLRGLGGWDRLYGGPGNDLVDGGLGNDRLYGGAGKDTVYGRGGDDLLSGGAGTDRLFGGTGLNVCLTGEVLVDC